MERRNRTPRTPEERKIIIDAGRVVRVDYAKDRASVTIHGYSGEKTFSFYNNEKAARADNIRKCRLKQKTPVIMIGTENANHTIIGWLLYRDAGMVQTNSTALILGKIKRHSKMGAYVVRFGKNKECIVPDEIANENFASGTQVTVRIHIASAEAACGNCSGTCARCIEKLSTSAPYMVEAI